MFRNIIQNTKVSIYVNYFDLVLVKVPGNKRMVTMPCKISKNTNSLNPLQFDYLHKFHIILLILCSHQVLSIEFAAQHIFLNSICILMKEIFQRMYSFELIVRAYSY